MPDDRDVGLTKGKIKTVIKKLGNLENDFWNPQILKLPNENVGCR